jgi:glycosyltransferase involved in cell wall biosynthesis
MKTDMQNNPLATFALLAYNQEKYIREAVESAFSQTYTPLEIILSDDGSVDGTYRIMQEMAAAYEGPHSVIVRQSEVNQGLARHFLAVARLAKGQLVIEAGGDDISKPERTAKLVQAWLETGALGLCSRFDMISESGDLISKNSHLPMSHHVMRNYWLHGNELKLMHGAVSAYAKEAILLVGNEIPMIMTEDGVVSAALHFHNKNIHFIEDNLVLYRINPQALSNSGTKANMDFSDIIQSERKASRMAFYFKNFNEWLLAYRAKLEAVDNRSVIEFNEAAVKKDIKLYAMMNAWIDDSTFLKRLSFLLNYPRGRNWRWMLPRLFGLNCFAFIKSKIRS